MVRSLLKLSEVKTRVGLGHAEIYKRIKDRRFPAQIQVGKRAVRWSSEDIEQWVSERIEASRDKNQA